MLENEEVCKKEWYRSKRSTLSHTKPTVDNVWKVFPTLKYSKRTKVFVHHKSQVYKLCHLLTCLVGFQEGD